MKENHSRYWLGKHLSAEHKQKIGGIGELNGMYGKRHSAESIGIMKEKKQKFTYYTPFGAFPSSRAAGDYIGISGVTIITLCSKNELIITLLSCKRLGFPLEWEGKTSKEIGFSKSIKV